MARSVPKCKRAAYVYDRDFIVVDDISGVLKMRSECAIDGYGFLSSQGDIRNPQEIPPIINEQMAAWPDPRPIGQNVFTPSPDYQYFLFNYTVTDVSYGSSTFDAFASVGLNAPVASIAWTVDGVYAETSFTPTLDMDEGSHDLSVLLTDLYGNEQTFDFVYVQAFIPANAVLFMTFNGTNGQTTFTDLTGRQTPTGSSVAAKISTTQSIQGGSSLWLSTNNQYVRARPSGNSSNDFIWTGDFSVSCWVYQTGGLSGGHVFSTGLTNTGYGMCLVVFGTTIRLVTSTFATILEVADTYVNSAWKKLEVRRVSGVIEILKNDVVLGSVANTDSLGNGNMYVGGNNAFGSQMLGYVDNFMVTKG